MAVQYSFYGYKLKQHIMKIWYTLGKQGHLILLNRSVTVAMVSNIPLVTKEIDKNSDDDFIYIIGDLLHVDPSVGTCN